MTIAILSSTSGYHQLAQTLSLNENVFHYGSHPDVLETDSYHPVPVFIPVKNDIDQEIKKILKHLKKQKIDFVMANGLSVPANQLIHSELNSMNIPYFFVNRKVAAFEYNKFLCKQMLNELGIPTAKSIGNSQFNGKYLFENFYSIPRPFVVKSYPYQHGRQTTIVDNDNYQEVFLNLFSGKLGKGFLPTNINDDFGLVIEECVDIKKELSCHFLLNSSGWQYFGSARDYKKVLEDDIGFNSMSFGAYNVHTIDYKIFDYADKIYKHFKKIGIPYKGFLFLGIAINENNVPVVLEINTRSGDPEFETIVKSVTNNLSDLFLSCAADSKIPEVKHDNTKKTVTVSLVKNVYDWTTKATDVPILKNIPNNISVGLEGSPECYLKHSGITATAGSHKAASNRIYKYLKKQDLGQFRYRTDIGILK